MAQTDLGKWMMTNGGNYNPETTYEQLTIVLYNDSMFLTLKTVKGITPVNDNINYSLMAQGAATILLSGINATDTYGVLGEVGATVSSQALVDYLADSVINKLIAKTQIANNLTTQDSDKVLSALQGYNLKQSIDKVNNNLGHFQYALINSKQSHTFSVNTTCWFVLHGYTDQNGSLFAGDVRGRLYTLCGIDSSAVVLVSFNDNKLTITNNINWAEVFIVFG